MTNKTPSELFWEKVVKTDTCWNWTAYRHPLGYGGLTVHKKKHLAHRWAYEQLVGPIPKGLTIDHLCKNTSCVNPSHMEVVTRSENTKRARVWEKGIVASAAIQKAKTHCVSGHEYTSENTFVNKKGGRDCRICRRAACRKNYHNERAKQGIPSINRGGRL